MASLIEKVGLPVLRVHDTVYQQTNGWIGHRLMGLPSLLLHTVGAKTGQGAHHVADLRRATATTIWLSRPTAARRGHRAGTTI